MTIIDRSVSVPNQRAVGAYAPGHKFFGNQFTGSLGDDDLDDWVKTGAPDHDPVHLGKKSEAAIGASVDAHFVTHAAGEHSPNYFRPPGNKVLLGQAAEAHRIAAKAHQTASNAADDQFVAYLHAQAAIEHTKAAKAAQKAHDTHPHNLAVFGKMVHHSQNAEQLAIDRLRHYAFGMSGPAPLRPFGTRYQTDFDYRAIGAYAPGHKFWGNQFTGSLGTGRLKHLSHDLAAHLTDEDRDVLTHASAEAANLPVGQKSTGTGPMNDEEYRLHLQHVEHEMALHGVNDLMRSPFSTHVSEDRIPGAPGAYNPARQKQHDQIVADILAKHLDVPQDRKAIITGGLFGAGKSTILRTQAKDKHSIAGRFGIKYNSYDEKGNGVGDPSNFVTINPDDIKEEMAKRGMIPQIDELSPNESATFVHEESSQIAAQLTRAATAQGRNIIHDVSLKTPSSGDNRIDPIKQIEHPYNVAGLFVDVGVDQSVRNAISRHRHGQDAYDAGKGFGGRYAPLGMIRDAGMGAAPYRSKNRANFEALVQAGKFDHWLTVNNEGYAGQVIGEGHGANVEFQRAQSDFEPSESHITEHIKAYRAGELPFDDLKTYLANHNYAAPDGYREPHVDESFAETKHRFEPHTWGEVIGAHMDGLLSDDEYDQIHQAMYDAHMGTSIIDDGRRADLANRQDKDDVNYRISQSLAHSCHTCVHRIDRGAAPSICELVKGTVDPHHVCDLWAGARGEGDHAVGHPFYGNQYVHNWIKSHAWKTVGTAKRLGVHIGEVFSHEPSPEAGEGVSLASDTWKNVPSEPLDPRYLVPTQQVLFKDKLLAAEQDREPIQALIKNGQTYILNGHHRTARAIIGGSKTIQARVVKATTEPATQLADPLDKYDWYPGEKQAYIEGKIQWLPPLKPEFGGPKAGKVTPSTSHAFKKYVPPPPPPPLDETWKLQGKHDRTLDYFHTDLHAFTEDQGGWGPKKNPHYGMVVFNEKGQVLLREPKNHFDGYAWTFSKGGPNYGEHPTQSALRETKEETGYTSAIVGHIPGDFSGSLYGSKNHFYLGLETSGQRDDAAVAKNKETAATIWADPQQALNLIAQTTNYQGRYRDFQILKAAYESWDKLHPGHHFPPIALPPPPPPPPKTWKYGRTFETNEEPPVYKEYPSWSSSTSYKHHGGGHSSVPSSATKPLPTTGPWQTAASNFMAAWKGKKGKKDKRSDDLETRAEGAYAQGHKFWGNQYVKFGDLDNDAFYAKALEKGFKGWNDAQVHEQYLKTAGLAPPTLPNYTQARAAAYMEAIRAHFEQGLTGEQLRQAATNKGHKKAKAAGTPELKAKFMGTAHGYAQAAKELKAIEKAAPKVEPSTSEAAKLVPPPEDSGYSDHVMTTAGTLGKHLEPSWKDSGQYRAAFAEKYAALTPTQRSFLHDYHYSDYGAINAKLRGVMPPKVTTTGDFFEPGQHEKVDADTAIAAIDSAMQPTPYDTIVTRNISPEALGLPEKFGTPSPVKSISDKLETTLNQTFHEKGYMSTSLGEAPPTPMGSGPDVVLHLKVPKGTPSIPVYANTDDEALKDEHELLLGHGLSYKVTSIGSVPGKGYTVHAEVVPPVPSFALPNITSLEDDALDKALKTWTSYGGHTKVTAPQLHRIQSAIDTKGTPSSVELHRGIIAQKTVAEKYAPGAHFKLVGRSFSPQLEAAETYATNGGSMEENERPVVLHLPAGTKALNVDKYGQDNGYYDEEHLVNGHFVVDLVTEGDESEPNWSVDAIKHVYLKPFTGSLVGVKVQFSGVGGEPDVKAGSVGPMASIPAIPTIQASTSTGPTFSDVNPDGLPKSHLFSTFEKVEGPKGSNPAQWYEDQNGQQYILKQAKDEEHVWNEVATGVVYKVAGIHVPETGAYLTHLGDGDVEATGVISKKIEGLKPWEGTPEQQADARKGFGIDALTSNYDALGLVNDNSLIAPGNEVVRIDQGGGGFFRAMGANKPGFSVGAWDKNTGGVPSDLTAPDYKTLRHSEQGLKLYGAPTGTHDEEIRASLEKAANLDLNKVGAMMTAKGVPAWYAQKYLDVLKDRQEHLKSKVLKTGTAGGVVEPSTSAGIGALVAPSTLNVGDVFALQHTGTEYKLVGKNDDGTFELEHMGFGTQYHSQALTLPVQLISKGNVVLSTSAPQSPGIGDKVLVSNLEVGDIIQAGISGKQYRIQSFNPVTHTVSLWNITDDQQANKNWSASNKATYLGKSVSQPEPTYDIFGHSLTMAQVKEALAKQGSISAYNPAPSEVVAGLSGKPLKGTPLYSTMQPTIVKKLQEVAVTSSEPESEPPKEDVTWEKMDWSHTPPTQEVNVAHLNEGEYFRHYFDYSVGSQVYRVDKKTKQGGGYNKLELTGPGGTKKTTTLHSNKKILKVASDWRPGANVVSTKTIEQGDVISGVTQGYKPFEFSHQQVTKVENPTSYMQKLTLANGQIVQGQYGVILHGKGPALPEPVQPAVEPAYGDDYVPLPGEKVVKQGDVQVGDIVKDFDPTGHAFGESYEVTAVGGAGALGIKPVGWKAQASGFTMPDNPNKNWLVTGHVDVSTAPATPSKVQAQDLKTGDYIMLGTDKAKVTSVYTTTSHKNTIIETDAPAPHDEFMTPSTKEYTKAPLESGAFEPHWTTMGELQAGDQYSYKGMGGNPAKTSFTVTKKEGQYYWLKASTGTTYDSEHQPPDKPVWILSKAGSSSATTSSGSLQPGATVKLSEMQPGDKFTAYGSHGYTLLAPEPGMKFKIQTPTGGLITNWVDDDMTFEGGPSETRPKGLTPGTSVSMSKLKVGDQFQWSPGAATTYTIASIDPGSSTPYHVTSPYGEDAFYSEPVQFVGGPSATGAQPTPEPAAEPPAHTPGMVIPYTQLEPGDVYMSDTGAGPWEVKAKNPSGTLNVINHTTGTTANATVVPNKTKMATLVAPTSPGPPTGDVTVYNYTMSHDVAQKLYNHLKLKEANGTFLGAVNSNLDVLGLTFNNGEKVGSKGKTTGFSTELFMEMLGKALGASAAPTGTGDVTVFGVTFTHADAQKLADNALMGAGISVNAQMMKLGITPKAYAPDVASTGVYYTGNGKVNAAWKAASAANPGLELGQIWLDELKKQLAGTGSPAVIPKPGPGDKVSKHNESASVSALVYNPYLYNATKPAVSMVKPGDVLYAKPNKSVYGHQEHTVVATKTKPNGLIELTTNYNGKFHTYQLGPTNSVYQKDVTGSGPSVTPSVSTPVGGTITSAAPSVQAIPSTSPPEEFIKKFHAADTLENMGVPMAVPQMSTMTDDQLRGLEGYTIGKKKAEEQAMELSPEDNAKAAEIAKDRKDNALSPSEQAAALAFYEVHSKAAGDAKPKVEGEQPTEKTEEPEDLSPEALKELPAYKQAQKDAKQLIESDATSRDLYKKAGDLSLKADANSKARSLAYHAAASKLDAEEGESPSVYITPGHPDLTPEQVTKLNYEAKPAGEKDTKVDQGGDLEQWAYNQGRALGVGAGASVWDTATAADIFHAAVEADGMMEKAHGLYKRKLMGFSHTLYRQAQAKMNGTAAITTSASDTAPKPDVSWTPPAAPGSAIHAAGQYTIKQQWTSSEASAISHFTGPSRWSTGMSGTGFYPSLNKLMAGQDPGNSSGAMAAKTFVKMAATRSVPSKNTIFRGVDSDAFKPGQLANWKQQLAKGENPIVNMGMSSASYTDATYFQQKKFLFVFDPGTMTVDIGTNGDHPSEIETVPSGMFEVYKIDTNPKLAGQTRIFVKPIIHFPA